MLVLLGSLILCASMTERMSGSIEYTELTPWERCDVSFHRPDIYIDGSDFNHFDPDPLLLDMDGDGTSEFRFYFVKS